MKISTKNTKVVRLSRNTRQWSERQHTAAGGDVQVPRGVVFTSDGRQNKETDTWIGQANAVLRELFCSMVTKRELSNTAKMSVLLVFVPILTYCMVKNLGQ